MDGSSAGAGVEFKPERRLTLRIDADLADDVQALAREAATAENSGEIEFPPGHVERLQKIASGVALGINERPDLGREQHTV